MAFGPDSCLYTLDILGPVGHFGISNRPEIENRLLIDIYCFKQRKKRSVLLLFSPFPKQDSPVFSILVYSLICISSHYASSVQFFSGHPSRCLSIWGTPYSHPEPIHVSRLLYCWALQSLFVSTSAHLAFLHSENSAFSVLQNSPSLYLQMDDGDNLSPVKQSAELNTSGEL